MHYQNKMGVSDVQVKHGPVPAADVAAPAPLRVFDATEDGNLPPRLLDKLLNHLPKRFAAECQSAAWP